MEPPERESAQELDKPKNIPSATATCTNSINDTGNIAP
jgi:hypothetical protein